MIDQSPAPHRRRRRPQQPQESAPVPTPAVRPLPGEIRRTKKRRSPLRITRPAQIVIGFLLITALLTTGVAVTKNYLKAQEERRRLEAEAAERAQHPLYYESWIRQYAQAQNIDPALVAAIILCESSFDTQATSRLNARGLMQTMEDTAQWIAHKLGEDDKDYSFDLLYDPETSIRFGCWHLGYLCRRFDGDLKKVVCAYHAGQGNVDSWLKNPAYSSDGVTLDVIPYDNTAHYAGRVLRAIEVYRKYYFPIETPTDGASSPQGD